MDECFVHGLLLSFLLTFQSVPRNRTQTKHVISLTYAPSDQCMDAFYSVMRAGHVQAGPDHHFERDNHPGHEIVLCLNGKGHARIGGRHFEIKPGAAIWINGHHPHAYWADPDDPWEVYWLLFEGPRLEHVWKMFMDGGGPVVHGCDATQKKLLFERIFQLLEDPQPSLSLHVHAEMARLIALLFFPLKSAEPNEDPKNIPEPLRRAVERMRIYHHLPLRISELSVVAGMSPSHFIRTFKKVMGKSPIDWVRHERIHHAQRRLAESEDSMKQIARQVGYNDQFYFSRDFKRLVGVTPTDYRNRERLKR